MINLETFVPYPPFSVYWPFVQKRWAIYEQRLGGDPPPWTADPILAKYKFTNVFRATDRVSQYVIALANSGPSRTSFREQFFRTILFKIFNKIETWETLCDCLGEEPSLANFGPERYTNLLGQIRAAGQSIYSSAYVMPALSQERHASKHAGHLDLLRYMLKTGLPESILESGGLKTAYLLLRAVPSLGDFLAYQYAIDLNYGPFLGYQESEFIVAGPGAREGIKKCFANPQGFSAEYIIRFMTEHADDLSQYYTGQPAPRLFMKRPLQLIDIQNCFCETAKYTRVSHPEANQERSRIKHTYDPSTNRPLPELCFPAQWDLEGSVR